MQKLIFIFLLIGFGSHLVAQPLTNADQMPYFPGCDRFENGTKEKRGCSNQALVTFISNYLRYPDAAQEKRVEGTVYVSFVVEENGTVSQAAILRDIGSGCGDAALDVLRKMPSWESGVHEGKRVPVKLNLPIQFSFTAGSPEEEEVPFKVHWGMLKSQQVSKDELRANSGNPIQVRDLYGNEIPINELLFVYEKKRTYLDAKSNGQLNKKMEKVIRRARKGGLFSVVVTIQQHGEFVYVEREFEVVE